MKKQVKILVPLDGSKNSLRALDTAILLFKNQNVIITGFHVIRFPVMFSKEIRKQYITNAHNIMKVALKHTKQHGVRFVDKIQYDGYIGNTIVKFAQDHKFNLIIIGSRGPNPIAEMFLGSVANYVINKAKMPVLLVK
ncbi:MAG: universal stress protein [Thaumarchaeota archaeon]|nr:universal stress protein [Nitrososphaerota archaeon]